jgi:hypothetical protein
MSPPTASMANRARGGARRTVDVRYVGSRPVYVRGAVTGRRYAFARVGEVLPVDAGDVPGLVRTGLFVRA